MKAQFNEGSNFDRTGQKCVATYMGTTIITGIILESRVKYGGKVQHTVQSTEDVVFYGEKRIVGSHFLVEESELLVAI